LLAWSGERFAGPDRRYIGQQFSGLYASQHYREALLLGRLSVRRCSQLSTPMSSPSGYLTTVPVVMKATGI
jgi:hypothetical protein